MRIQSINNTVNFGYNKQLNDTVNKKLEKAKGNKELAKTLLEMNRFANATEDKLRQAEKNKNQQKKHIALGIKCMFAVLMQIKRQL